MQRSLRIGYVHRGDTTDVNLWSGTPYFIRRALQRNVGEVVELGPAPVQAFREKFTGRMITAVTGRQAPVGHMESYSRKLGRFFENAIRNANIDLLFVPGERESVAYLESDLPLFVYSDATWLAIVDYYKPYSNVAEHIRRAGEKLDRRVFEKARNLLVASEWASNSLVNDYGVSPRKISVPYIGANLQEPPVRESIAPADVSGRIDLLMVGVDWTAKGGDVAVSTLEQLRARGIDAHLTVVGCVPPKPLSTDHVTVHPFLDKSNRWERHLFDELWKAATFFILPSRYEAAGIVFCEAAAYGVPALGARTGGVPSLVIEGRTGFTIPFENEPDAYADKIEWLVQNPDEYATMSRLARNEYEHRLNWDVWGRSVGNVIADELVGTADLIEDHRSREASISS